jgi:hypothetical protein
MATVHIPRYDELSEEQREVVARLAKREGVAADELSLSYRAKVHWPEYFDASTNELRYNFKALGALPTMTKEGIHVAVSMVNKCDF